MKRKYLPVTTSLKEEYPNIRSLVLLEGGGYYFATKNEKYYIFKDERTMMDLLDDDDDDLIAKLLEEFEFDTKKDCLNFIKKTLAVKFRGRLTIVIPKELE